MPDELGQYSAVQLFVQRARQVRRQFTLGGGEKEAVVRICRRVEGLPLAIELAAAGVRSQSCTQIAAAIEFSLTALAGSFRAMPERHQSMWATFEHSWQLLNEMERSAFAQVSVFRGGCTEQAATVIAGAPAELLAALVDKSLLRWEGTRYVLHELLRQYGTAKLEELGRHEVIARKHGLYYLDVCLGMQSAAQERRSAALDVLEHEHDNLHAALSWMLQHNEYAMGVRLVSSLASYWEVRGYWREGLMWGEAFLVQSRGKLLSAACVELLHHVAHLTRRQGDYRKAMALCEEALAICRKLNDDSATASALRNLGRVAWAEEDHARAVAHYEEALELGRTLPDQKGVVDCLCRLGQLAQEQGDELSATRWFKTSLSLCRSLERRDLAASLQLLASAFHREYGEALALLDEALTLWREGDDQEGMANSLRHLGELAYEHGDYDRASERYAESLMLYQEVGDRHGVAMILLDKGALAYVRGDDDQAEVFYTESLRRHQDLGNAWGVATTLCGLGRIALRQNEIARALTCVMDNIERFRSLKDVEGIASCLLLLAGMSNQETQLDKDAHLVEAPHMLTVRTTRIGLVDQGKDAQRVPSSHSQLDSSTYAALQAVRQAPTHDEAMTKAREGARTIVADTLADT